MSNGIETDHVHPVVKALCLPHPNRSGQLVLRMGRNKSGGHVLFEAEKNCMRPSRWRYFRNATPAESGAFEGIDLREIEAAHGPAGMRVFFHKSELR